MGERIGSLHGSCGLTLPFKDWSASEYLRLGRSIRAQEGERDRSGEAGREDRTGPQGGDVEPVDAPPIPFGAPSLLQNQQVASPIPFSFPEQERRAGPNDFHREVAEADSADRAGEALGCGRHTAEPQCFQASLEFTEL